jgi:hypothetical protein
MSGPTCARAQRFRAPREVGRVLVANAYSILSEVRPISRYPSNIARRLQTQRSHYDILDGIDKLSAPRSANLRII